MAEADPARYLERERARGQWQAREMKHQVIRVFDSNLAVGGWIATGTIPESGSQPRYLTRHHGAWPQWPRS
jgi:hypothetical protein